MSNNRLSLSQGTIDILKNFASINETLLFPQGSTLITRSVNKHTYAEAKVEEVFPKKFCIYNLNQFLAVVSQFVTPVLDFGEDEAYVRVSDESGGLSVKYHYGNLELAYTPTNKKLELPSVDAEFELTEVNFKSLFNMARTLGTPELALTSDRKTLNLVTMDSKISSANTTSMSIGEAPNSEFSFVWKFEYLKLISGTYDVSVCKEGIARFKHTTLPLTYHVLLECNASSYKE